MAKGTDMTLFVRSFRPNQCTTVAAISECMIEINKLHVCISLYHEHHRVCGLETEKLHVKKCY